MLLLQVKKTNAQSLPRLVTTVEGIKEYELDNGLRVLLIPDASQTNIAVNIVYKVGSRHEGYGESGMAHLLEHMLFKPTKQDKQKNINTLSHNNSIQHQHALVDLFAVSCFFCGTLLSLVWGQ